MLLEARLHTVPPLFVTLTYAPEHLPPGGSLSKRDVHLYLGRLRAELLRDHQLRYRFGLVGEYGDVTVRPHYHGIFYGVPWDLCSVFRDQWGLGLVDVQVAGQGSPGGPRKALEYVCGYLNKGATSWAALWNGFGPQPLRKLAMHNVQPEFWVCSRRPALGAGAIPLLAAHFRSPEGQAYWLQRGVVPREVMIEGARWPLDRFMQSKLRLALGLSDTGLLPGQSAAVEVAREVGALTIADHRSRATGKARDKYSRWERESAARRKHFRSI